MSPTSAKAARFALLMDVLTSCCLATSVCTTVDAVQATVLAARRRVSSTHVDHVQLLQHEVAVYRPPGGELPQAAAAAILADRVPAEEASAVLVLPDTLVKMDGKQASSTVVESELAPKPPISEITTGYMTKAKDGSIARLFGLIVVVAMILVLCWMGGLLAFTRSDAAYDGIDKDHVNVMNAEDAEPTVQQQQRPRRNSSSIKAMHATPPATANSSCCMGFLPGASSSSSKPAAQPPAPWPRPILVDDKVPMQGAVVGTNAQDTPSVQKVRFFSGGDEVVHFSAEGRGN